MKNDFVKEKSKQLELKKKAIVKLRLSENEMRMLQGGIGGPIPDSCDLMLCTGRPTGGTA